MRFTNRESYGYRLVQILKKLNQGQKLNPKTLAEEFGVNLRAIQRDLNERFAFLGLVKTDGSYHMPPTNLGKLNFRDVERFASLAGVKGLFPSLNDDYLRELFHSQLNSAVLVKGPAYEDLGGKEVLFHQLEVAIVSHQHISYTYEKSEGTKNYCMVQPYKLINHDGIWYLSAMHGSQLKAFTLIKINRLQVESSTFEPNPVIHKTLAQDDGIWLNLKKLDVVLRVTEPAAGYFRRRKLVPNQIIEEELEDGSLIVSSKVAHANQILPIVRQWMPCIFIIKPKILIKKNNMEINKYLDLNSSGN